MKFKKNKSDLIETAKSFESLSELRDSRSKKLAWLLAGIGIFFSFCCVIAITVMLPLKTVEYRIIAVDSLVGRGQVLTSIKEKEITEQEAVERYYSSLYVKLREHYNYFTLQNDYDTVQLYNSPEVNFDYLALFNSDKSPDVVYDGAKNTASVEIISHSVTYGTDPDSMAMIRFKKTIRNIRTNKTVEYYFIARLSFRFDLNKKMTEKEREVNPLGFTITSYNVDQEFR